MLIGLGFSRGLKKIGIMFGKNKILKIVVNSTASLGTTSDPESEKNARMFKEQLDNSKHLVALTGAGISAESGIPTFRGAGGLWRNYDAMVSYRHAIVSFSDSQFLNPTLLIRNWRLLVHSRQIRRLYGSSISTDATSF